MNNVIKNFVIAFSANINPLLSGLRKASGGFESLNSNVSKFAGLLGVAFGGGAMINTMANLGNELKNFSDLTGISSEDTSRLGSVLAKFGGSANDAMNDLKALQTAMFDSLKGEGALIEANKEFGISISNQGGKLKDSSKTLKELADQFSKMNKQSAIAAGSKLGLSESTIRLLMQGKDGVDKLFKSQDSLGKITDSEIEASKDFNSMLKDLKFAFEKISLVILKAIMPAFKSVHDVFLKVMKAFNDNGFRAVKVFGAIFGILASVKVLMIGISLAAQGVLLPFTIIATVLAAIVLILDDVWTFLEGGDSVLGDWVNKNETVKAAVEKIKEVFATIKEIVLNIVDYFKNLTFDKLIQDLGKLKDKILDSLSSPFKGWFGSDKKDIPIAKSNTNTTNNTNNTNNNNISIKQNVTTSDPKAFASETTDLIKKQLQNEVMATSGGGYQ